MADKLLSDPWTFQRESGEEADPAQSETAAAAAVSRRRPSPTLSMCVSAGSQDPDRIGTAASVSTAVSAAFPEEQGEAECGPELKMDELIEQEEQPEMAVCEKRNKQYIKRVKQRVMAMTQRRLQATFAQETFQALDSNTGSLADLIPPALQMHLVPQEDNLRCVIKKGFVPHMKAEGLVYASPMLMRILLEELVANQQGGASVPAIAQVANVASLPGIVGRSLGMADVHSGYGFAVGNVASFDMDDPFAVVAPGGVGFDINCGVRLLRSKLSEQDLSNGVASTLATKLMSSIPVGLGAEGALKVDREGLDGILEFGMEWLAERGGCWPEDTPRCEHGGRLAGARAAAVSARAKKRGASQLGSLGSGTNFVEVQVVDAVYDTVAAAAMGLDELGTVCVMIHSGSRGLGHQVCTDALTAMAHTTKGLNDRQLACAPIQSGQGQTYLAAMQAAANFAFANRGILTHCVRQAFEETFGISARAMDLQLVYDVGHNLASEETHVVEGVSKRLLVHRKGATRALPPGHPDLPEEYREIGQPVIVAGSMGTNSYVLTGTEDSVEQSFSSTCHGAGRSMPRTSAMRKLGSEEVLAALKKKGIEARVATPKLIAEEASQAYKDVDEVVRVCCETGLSRPVVRLRPLTVLKG